MLELFRDPVWQFAGFVVTALAVVISIAIYLAQRIRKNLVFDVLRTSKVLTEVEEAVGTMQLMFNGAVVTNASLVEIRFLNLGNQSISEVDFVKPVTIAFSESSRVLSAVVIDRYPNDLGATVVFDGRSATLMPLLLNPSDELTVKMLVAEGDVGQPIIQGRINGVQKIVELEKIKSIPEVWSMLLGMVAAMAASASKDLRLLYVAGAILVAVSFFLLIRRQWRRSRARTFWGRLADTL